MYTKFKTHRSSLKHKLNIISLPVHIAWNYALIGELNCFEKWQSVKVIGGNLSTLLLISAGKGENYPVYINSLGTTCLFALFMK